MAFVYRNNIISCLSLNQLNCKFRTNIKRFKGSKSIIQSLNNRRPAENDRYSNIIRATAMPKSDTFETEVNYRRLQASKTILVQVRSIESSDYLYSYCSQYGKIISMHHYNHFKDNFMLVEFENANVVKRVAATSVFSNSNKVASLKTSVFWFRDKNKDLIKQHFNIVPNKILSTTNGTEIPTAENIIKALQRINTISEQMECLYSLLKLNDLEVRLRFYTAQHIEKCLSGLFGNSLVQPFGSSVNGFGKKGCDLDLVFLPYQRKNETYDSHLVFHTKQLRLGLKQEQKEFMAIIAQIMASFAPGVFNLQRVLNARVPIIKFGNMYTHIDCDLSITNHCAIHMSELLYIFGKLDDRVRPLVFTIRMWAKFHRLTSPSPGRWITNFSLTLLALFYLQIKQILPTLDTLKLLATYEDIRFVDSDVDCTFLRNINKIIANRKKDNHESLESLLRGFFQYYASFEYEKHAISLRTGTEVLKKDSSPLYICNPLETSLNVSKNVNMSELQRLKLHIQDAVFFFDSIGSQKTLGLLPLLGISQNQELSEIKETESDSGINTSLLVSKDTSSAESLINDENVTESESLGNVVKQH